MRLRIPTSLALGAAAVVAAAGLSAPTSASASPRSPTCRRTSAKQLTSLTGTTLVLVHGENLQAATSAVKATGMRTSTTFRKIGVVGAVGTKSQIQAVRSQPGVTYVEAGRQPIDAASRRPPTRPPAASRPPRR